MFLISLMLWIQAYQAHPHFSQTAPGEYVEIVKTEYDAGNNQTYMILEKYQVLKDISNVNWQLMQPRPFPGNPSNAQMLSTVEVSSGIIKVQ